MRAIGKKLRRLKKVHDRIVSIKMSAIILDETRFHSFCLKKDVSTYIRMCVLIYNKIMRSRPLTDEQTKRLDEIGGWPSLEEQEKRVAEAKKNLGEGKKLGSNTWLPWDRIDKNKQEESDLHAEIKTESKSEGFEEEKIMVPIEEPKD